MYGLGKHCAQSDANKPIPQSTEERIASASELLNSYGIAEETELIGVGKEAIILSDKKTIFKVFDRPLEYYYDLFKQLKGRFSGCKHIISDFDVLYIKSRTVLMYKNEESTAYTGGLESQMQDFLVEAALCGIVCKDVKLNNLRVFSGTLKLIDYGWDIIPFNYKDFIFMAQRAYLSINKSNGPEFNTIAKVAINTWDLLELEGFNEFFNEVYSKLLIAKEKNDKCELLTVPENLWIEDTINVFFEDGPGTIFDERISFGLEDSFRISDNIQPEKKVAIVFDDRRPDMGNILRIRERMDDGQNVMVIFKNTFFREEMPTIEPIIRDFENVGLNVLDVKQSPPRPYHDGTFFSRLICFETEAFRKCGNDTSLLIKVCYQDSEMLKEMVEHITSQLIRPDGFKEVLVVLDSKEDSFMRQYSIPNKQRTLDILDGLMCNGTINGYFTSPSDEKEISDINRRWFGIECENTHCIRNIPVTPQLFGFEKCTGDYILQTDCDSIIIRRDCAHRYLLDMKNALTEKNALSVSFNIAHQGDLPKEYTSNDQPYVPEVRICLLNRGRFFGQRPYPNELTAGKMRYTWYRSVEIAEKERNLHSLRGGDPRSFYIHPRNEMKHDKEFWNRVLDSAELGVVPSIQMENVDLHGNRYDWTFPKRSENFIFIISGRNVSNEKFLRGWQSIVSQTRKDWGAIIINDNSDNNIHEFIKTTIRPFADRTTYICNRSTNVILKNIHGAIRNVCTNPYSVIVIMDMDDMLLTNDVLTALRKEYLTGADMVVGTALKTTKGILPFIPDFKNPRNERMGDVWIHLRSFRKYLFDAIDDDQFKHEGEWIDKFNELTYTVPIAEMSDSPRHVTWPLYLWEPGHIRDTEHYRLNGIIKDIIRKKPSYSGREPKRVFEGYSQPPGELFRGIPEEGITFMRHAEREKSANRFPNPHSRTTERGQREARLWGKTLRTKVDLFLTSTLERTMETANCINEGGGSSAKIIQMEYLAESPMKDRVAWEELKKELGFFGAINLWMEGRVSEDVCEPPNIFTEKILKAIWDIITKEGAKKVIAVTHEYMIMILHRIFHNTESHRVCYMGGFSVTINELYKKLIETRTKNADHKKFRTPSDTIEVDITYRCDLLCKNCDRSCRQAPSEDDISHEQITSFLDMSDKKEISWKRIRIMGGEPLLHPDIGKILEIFGKYSKNHPNTEIELYTNGIPKKMHPDIPYGIKIHNTSKANTINNRFEPYNMAPKDILDESEDYRNGCWITSYCGMGLNKYGFYPCAAGAAIDRVFGLDIGYREIPSEQDLIESRIRLCSLCGHYLGDGNYSDYQSRLPLMDMEPMTATWSDAYIRYKKTKPDLTVGGRL